MRMGARGRVSISCAQMDILRREGARRRIRKRCCGIVKRGSVRRSRGERVERSSDRPYRRRQRHPVFRQRFQHDRFKRGNHARIIQPVKQRDPHPWRPEPVNVIGDPIDRFRAIRHRIEKFTDLVRHFDQAVHIHDYFPDDVTAASRSCKNSSCCVLKREYSFCHCDGCSTGMTCTAVTLYSGQFVAQSEESVVITFAPDSGKWNVVYTTPGCIRSVIFARSTVCPARDSIPTQSSALIPRSSASCGWISSRSSSCQREFSVRRVCAPTLYCDRMRPVVSSSGNLRVTFSSLGTYCVITKRPLPRTKWSTCMMSVPASAVESLQGHCPLPRRSIFS